MNLKEFFIAVPVLWTIANFVGWLTVRRSVYGPRPLNWRIFLGPMVYYNWIDRMGNDSYEQ